MKVLARAMTAIALAAVLLAPVLSRAETWTTPVRITELNSTKRDLEPWISADGRTLFFSSARVGNNSESLNNLQIYVSHLENGVWSTPEILPAPLNDPVARDGHPSLTLDGHYMYFHSNRVGGFGGIDTEYGLDIWESENINGAWQQPVVLPLGVNTTTMDVTPFVSVDGQTLIFSSGNPGLRDLYVSHKVGGVWQPIVKLGADTFDSALNEDSPSLSYTGKYLFFSRGGSGDGVASDIWRSVKIAGVWQAPVKLPSPVNTTHEEQTSIFNDCTNSMYMYYTVSGVNWDVATTQWTDFADSNPCSRLVIPEGEWRVRITLLEASASLKNDIYIDQPISQLLIRNSLKNVGTVVTTPFVSAEELILHIHVNAGSMGLGQYDHYSNTEFARVERTDPLRYIVGFEDLPADQADWDYNDTVLLVELIGQEVNIWEDTNYLGEYQMITESPVQRDSDLGLWLNYGDGLVAEAVVPGAGLVEPTYAILTEGDPALYQDLLGGAPFVSADTFVKVELTSGQEEMAGDNKVQLSVDFIPNPMPGDSATVTEPDPKIYKLDPDTQAWEELADQSLPAPNQLVAEAPGPGLYALGYPVVVQPTHINLNCGVTPGPAGPNSAAWLILICAPFLAGLAFRLTRKARA